MSPGVLKSSTSRSRVRPSKRRPRERAASSLLTHGEPWVWIAGGALAIAILMIAGFLALILWNGLRTFWQGPVVTFEGPDGRRGMGEISLVEFYEPDPELVLFMSEDEVARLEGAKDASGRVERVRYRTGNADLTGTHYEWISGHEVEETREDAWAILLEREEWGRFYGTPVGFKLDGELVATSEEAAWESFREHHGTSRERFDAARAIEKDVIAKLRDEEEAARLELRRVELTSSGASAEYTTALERFQSQSRELRRRSEQASREIRELRRKNQSYVLVMRTADGREKDVVLADIVRAVRPNGMSFGSKLGLYLSRWWEFLSDDPRSANNEGGVFPAIFGTVVMTMLMSILVVPFGVLAALYLREYAKPGFGVSAVRIAVNNLAGVPSIVFGIFGLGFFCYIVGAQIDELLFEEHLPNQTFGTRGILWASLTLALLTLPVVIVATEEALSAVPNSMREGSYACGATKWQTIRRIILPRAAPGILTGMILAIARGAGEVAPLMLVGAMKTVRNLPVDGTFPYLHLERSFMHLGFHIFDLGFHSQNSEAAKPMVYTTTLLLILIVVLLNVAAIWVRARLRRRFEVGTI